MSRCAEKANNERSIPILCHLEGKVFEWYYEIFVPDRALTKEPQNYYALKSKFLVESSKKTKQEE